MTPFGSKLRLNARLAVTAAALLVLVLVVFGALIVSVTQLRHLEQQAVYSERVIRQAQMVQNRVLDLQSGQRGYIITGDRRFLEPWTRGRARLPGTLDGLVGLTREAGQKQRARAIAATANGYLHEWSEPLVATALKDRRAAAREVIGGEGLRLLSALQGQLGAFLGQERVLLDRRSAQARTAAHRATAIGVGGLVLFVLVTVALLWFFNRSVVRPLVALNRGAGRLEEGELSARVAGDAPAEAGELIDRFNTMAAELEQSHDALLELNETSAATLDAFFAGAPVGLAVLDEELRFVRVNEALAHLDGQSAEEHIGRTIPEVLPGLDHQVVADSRRVLASGESRFDVEVSGELPKHPGEQRWWRMSYYPIRTRDDRVRGLAQLVTEVTAEREAQLERERLLAREQLALRRTRSLYELGAALGAATRSTDVARVACRHARASFGAAAAALFLSDHDGASAGLVAAEGWRKLPLTELTPASHGTAAIAYLRNESMYNGDGDPLIDGTGVALSLSVGGQLRAVLAMSFDGDAEFTSERREFAAAFADQCAQALERARLFEREHDIAHTLQESLLPERLPAVAGLGLSAAYRPAGLETEVGGDFYDVFALPDERFLVVVGDVCGKGPEAAAVTALARYTLRAEAVHGAGPAELLTRLNTALLAQRSDMRFITVACALLERTEAGFRVRLAIGGHPLPIVCPVDGVPTPVGSPGTLIGVMHEATFDEVEFELGSSSRMLFYTDGLLEAAAPARQLGSADLADLCALCAGLSGDEFIACVQQRAGADGPVVRDDIALVLLEPVRERSGAAV